MNTRTQGDLWQPRRGKITLLEAQPGGGRSRLLHQILEVRSLEQSTRTWLLDCDFGSGGVWAGVQDLVKSLLEEIRVASPELLRRHDYELLQVLPELQDSLSPRFQSLTDTSSGEEKVRSYPADRAFRSIHGIIDLLAEWKQTWGDEPWLILCDHYDSASQISRRFFRELMRRSGHRSNVSLLAVVSPRAGERMESSFHPGSRGPLLKVEVPREETPKEDPSEIERLAEDLDRRIGNDKIQIRKQLPRMVRLWSMTENSDRSLKWNLLGLSIYTDAGLYADALTYGEAARRIAAAARPDDGALRWMIFFKLFACYMALRDTAAALRLTQEDALGRTERSEWRSQLYYQMAMLYARYLPHKDFDKAEDFLQRGLEELEKTDLPSESLLFRAVFNRNGLAMIRNFQGRYEEAIELCRSSFERLRNELREDRHKLHRSVLLYNIAQVFATIGCLEEAVAHYSAAIEMDPNYSEYYNERGSLFLKMGAVDKAAADYQKAIELSPPYFEVHTNLGQCYRRMGRAADAVREYSRALDLEPDQLLALLGRAQAWAALGRNEEAISDYTSVLNLVPKQWEALANRAILYYEGGLLQESLADLDHALEIAPDQADLYQNRAVVCTELGMIEEAIRDLSTYLSLQQDAPDRAAVEERLSELRSLAGLYPVTAAERSASQAARSTT